MAPCGEVWEAVFIEWDVCLGVNIPGQLPISHLGHSTAATLTSRWVSGDAPSTVMNQDRSPARQHIVRVLRGPSLSAYSQISGGFGFR
jgi:hypothetical protein